MQVNASPWKARKVRIQNFWFEEPVSSSISLSDQEASISLLSFSIRVSTQFSCSVVPDSLWPHKSQHARTPCPSPTPGVHSNSCPLIQWCHSAISSSVIPFFSCSQSLPASGSFPMSQLFAWGGQSIGVSVLASVLPMNTQDWSPSWWTGWISLQFRGLSRVFSSTTVWKPNSLAPSLLYVQFSHSCVTTIKTIALTAMQCLLFKCCLALYRFSYKVHASFNFMAEVI